MKKMFKLLSCLLALILTAAAVMLPASAGGSAFANSEHEGTEKEGTDDKNDQFLTLSATDALGRYTATVDGMRSDRYVGIFYFIWFDRSNPQALDTTKLLRTNPEELFDPRDQTGIAPPGAMYYFNEPLYGYYASTDRWVVSKHVELFTQAGIDFIALDLTNDVIYESALETLLSVLREYADAGWNVPRIMAYTNLNSGHTAQRLYDFMYKEGDYRDLWFYGPYDKPILVANKNEIENSAILDMFTIRPAQWPGYEFGFERNAWPFCDLNRPQRIHKNLIGVSVAQHNSYIFSYGMRPDPLYPMPRMNYGRGYTNDNPVNGNVDAILAGANIQEEWDFAISKDPEIIFVTGWNEWATNKRLPEYEDQTVAWFVDSFNTEFSRDMEMTASPTYVYDEATGKYIEEGYGDNYYCQLVNNIRRYKGITSDTVEAQAFVRVDMTAYREDDWRHAYTFANMSVGNEPRTDENYRLPAAANYIKELRLTNDDSHVYFLITTAEVPVLDPSDHSLLNLLVGVHGNDKTGFEGYQYLINRQYAGNGKTSVEYTESGYDGFTKVADATVTVDGTHVMIAVPREALGVAGQDAFTLYVKATDSVQHPDRLLDYYVSGEVLPLGRFNCTYHGAGTLSEQADVTEAPSTVGDMPTDTESETAAPVVEPATADGTDTAAPAPAGCSSAVSAAAVVLMLGGAMTAVRRKE